MDALPKSHRKALAHVCPVQSIPKFGKLETLLQKSPSRKPQAPSMSKPRLVTDNKVLSSDNKFCSEARWKAKIYTL